MTKDITNIYNLTSEEIEAYSQNPWPEAETKPGTKEFAEKFKQEIISLDTPHVLALEGGYGVGKTYFITRFCEYLKKKNSDTDIAIEAVYLNLWENDYIEDPFPVIASQIISVLAPREEIAAEVKEKAIEITKKIFSAAVTKYTGVNVEELFLDVKKNKDDIREFKESLQKIISEKGKKIVLVIDELDRCRPDYAVKALETLKHFFNIEGLVVVLTTQIEYMNKICKAHYGNFECGNTEGYAQKFIQYSRPLNTTTKGNYKFIISQILNSQTLPLKNNNSNSENIDLINYFNAFFAKEFYSQSLSIRKTIDICNEIKILICRFNKRIWKSKVARYSEGIISSYLNRKGVFPKDIILPKVQWDDLMTSEDEEREKENILNEIS